MMNYKKEKVMGDTVIWYDKNGIRVSFIDPSPGNSDYQQYLEWLAKGNEPEIIEI